MKRYAIAVVGALALSAVAVAGCGDDNDGSSDSGGDKPAKVAMLVSSFTDYQKAQQDGLEKVLKPNGGSVKVFDAGFDPSKQLTQCTDVINSGRYNVILLNAPDPPSGAPCAKAAAKTNIPVIANSVAIGKDFNATEPQVDGVVGGVLITPVNNGKATVESVKAACEGAEPPCKLIVEQGSATDVFSNEILKQLSEMDGVKVVKKFITLYDPAEVSKAVPDILSAHADADVYVSSADNTAVVAAGLIKDAGLADSMKVLGNGASHAGLAAVKDGSLFSTIGDWPFQQGEILAKMATQAVNGKTVDPKVVVAQDIDTPLLINKDNADEAKSEWGAQ
jgi:ABC-type sugar transport system substrate-binding protein